MAISGGDGSIILTTKVDTSGIDKGESKIKNAANRMANAFKGVGVQLTKSTSQSKEVAKLQKEFDKTNESIDKTKAKIQELYSQLDELQANAFKSPDTQEPVLTKSEQKQFDKLNSQLDELEPKLERDKIKAQELGEAIKSASKGNIPAVKAVTKGIDNFGKRVAGLVKRVFVFTVILRALRALADILKNVAMGDEDFRQSVEQLQAALWVAFTPILNIIVPALKTMVDWLTKAAIAVGKFLAAISGKSYASMIQSAKGLKQQSDNYKKLGKNAKDAKKQLAGFDEIQILSSDSSEGAGGASTNIFKNFGVENEVDAMLSSIMGVVGGAMVALGVLLLFYGQIGWGIGFIIAGATTMGVNVANIANSDLGIAEKFSSIMAIVGGFILAIGIVLLLKVPSAQPLALGMIIAGAGVLAVSVAQTAANKLGGDVKNKLHGIITIVSGFALAIGIILLCFGQISPLSIGLVVTGAAGLATEIALYPDAVKEALQGWVGGVLAIVSGALLVLGIVLCVCGIVTPLSIGMIVVGAVGLVAELALNWNYVTKQVTNFFQKNAGLIVGVSVALIVLGIILLFTGVGIPLAIGLIVAGGGALAATVALNWNFIVDKVKEVWRKVKEFWNTHIAPIFTVEWWKNLGKNVMNGLIAGFEAGINGIIGMFEKMINWIVSGLNKIKFDVPDWVPGIGGKDFGFNIPKVKFGKVSIPRLAQGAVIPPNREFLAVLGDQKHGTNIEAPLQTIVDAFNIALQGNANYGGGNTEVVLEIDGREFGRAVVEQGNRENRRIGTRLVIA